MKDIHIIGKINLEIFKVITEDIQTDEVIITDERIQHIKDNHPGDYEKYFYKYAKSIVENPDYILKSDRPSTAILLKSFEEKGVRIKIIMRIKTSLDSESCKNSVLTFQYVEEKI